MTGHAAFERRSGENVVAQFVRISRQPTPQLRDGAIPDDVAAALEHAMARDPTDRPQSAAGFGAELQGIERQHRLLEAIQYVVPDLAGELGETLEEHGGAAAEYVLSSLIDGIEARGEPVTTVLDDWHRIHDRAAIAIMAYLLDNACDELTFVVTSRTRSGLPLGRMRVQHELVEIDSTASRFDCDEARQFLVELRNVELDRRDVDRLCESTEGWVAALQRASLSLSSGPDPAALIGRMSGRHHAIAEYLAENVLDTLDSDTRDFLLATSITERICASLASELSGVKRGQAKLEDIEERDLFLLRIDEDGHWFRYHNMFADFARRQLERDHPEHVAGLDLAAARWFGDRDYVSEAVDHALSADDASRATELVEQGGSRLLEHSQMSTLLGLIAKLREGSVRDSPQLQLFVAWASTLLQHPDPALTALERARAGIEQLAGGPRAEAQCHVA